MPDRRERAPAHAAARWTLAALLTAAALSAALVPAPVGACSPACLDEGWNETWELALESVEALDTGEVTDLPTWPAEVVVTSGERMATEGELLLEWEEG